MVEEGNNIKDQDLGLPANHIFWEKCDLHGEEFINAKYCLQVEVLNTTEYRVWMFNKPISRVFCPNIFDDAQGFSKTL